MAHLGVNRYLKILYTEVKNITHCYMYTIIFYLQTLLELKLVILDVNDNIPVFQRTNKTYQTRIDEVLHLVTHS